jgi:hypothetical protein
MVQLMLQYLTGVADGWMAGGAPGEVAPSRVVVLHRLDWHVRRAFDPGHVSRSAPGTGTESRSRPVLTFTVHMVVAGLARIGWSWPSWTAMARPCLLLTRSATPGSNPGEPGACSLCGPPPRGRLCTRALLDLASGGTAPGVTLSRGSTVWTKTSRTLGMPADVSHSRLWIRR